MLHLAAIFGQLLGRDLSAIGGDEHVVIGVDAQIDDVGHEHHPDHAIFDRLQLERHVLTGEDVLEDALIVRVGQFGDRARIGEIGLQARPSPALGEGGRDGGR
jgi:hypothetical protein